MAELAAHKDLAHLSDMLDEIDDRELIELVASVALLCYQAGVEEGWGSHKETVRLMDGRLV